MGVPFTIAAGPRQSSHSQVQVSQDSWPHFTVLDLRLPQPGGPGPCIYIPQEQVDQLYRQALGSLFVTSYDSRGYGGSLHTGFNWGQSQSHRQSYFTTSGLPPISLSWRQAPLSPTTRDFFPQLNPCSISPYVTSSLTRRWVCLLRICLAFSQVYILHIQHVIEKFLPLHYTQVLCQYRLCRADHACLIHLMLQSCLVTWTVVSLTTSKFKPLIFSMSGFTLSYTTNMFILMILYNFCFFPAQSYIYIYMEG
jgi:hypothetical protein